jgi:hypothetical protein
MNVNQVVRVIRTAHESRVVGRASVGVTPRWSVLIITRPLVLVDDGTDYRTRCCSCGRPGRRAPNVTAGETPDYRARPGTVARALALISVTPA